ncbi:MAG: class I SAM-dependent methyltransferase [Neisseria sp.]|uniref:class I SAM-dependent methyltransferase n=1 Tax=Neisseria sp. TaxID=192066 RepID=UPI0026DD4A9D|nr:class I SAM-dependent methyltransferase [Neisseria sp.]MDO4248288.1 class I SAM-dependent methyltransferase [Neisseria sp.]
MPPITFLQNQSERTLEWRVQSMQKPPRNILPAAECSADACLKNAYAHTATLWQGDFHNAKSVLAAIKKRLGKPAGALPESPAEAFHAHRMRQAQRARLANMLLVEIGAEYSLDLPRAPDVRKALHDVYGAPDGAPFLLPLNQLLGFIGAHEWHKKGIPLPVLNGRIHVPFGVFSPLRGEYLDLIAAAPLPEGCASAFDIGTGSGVIACLLARRGLPRISATDNNPRAIAAARANVARLGLSEQVKIEETDLFPAGKADLIVCNPPWLPAKPTSAVESALYDPQSAMLQGFLNGAAAHLNEGGEVWLIMSDLAEHLGLRAPGTLPALIRNAGLSVSGRHNTAPKHAKAHDAGDPLAFARMKETTSLYRLRPA